MCSGLKEKMKDKREQTCKREEIKRERKSRKIEKQKKRKEDKFKKKKRRKRIKKQRHFKKDMKTWRLGSHDAMVSLIKSFVYLV